MHLKELELYGFKSFGDKVKIGFHPRLTAIVGPNGSGKSNIVDSVRWLLGDQSNKNLRIPSSEEIIFKGSDNGLPFNFSHVGMVIDLGDEGELKVERRFHRSGENEYILNGKTVRMKDIRSLLSSKGFGLGSLSILSQGQIDTILSLVPTDRRIILEEVAQITNFKDNKVRILKKLEATRDNLTRLEDIRREVDSRLKELGEQAEAARKNRELNQVKEKLEINLSFKETERLVKNIRRNITELEEREHELFDLKDEISKREGQLKTLESELEELRGNLEKEFHRSRERTLSIEKYRSAMNLAQSELEHMRESRNSLTDTLIKVENELENIKQQIYLNKDKLDNAQLEKNKAIRNLEDLREKHIFEYSNEDEELARIESRGEESQKVRMEIDLLTQRLSILEDQAERSSQHLEEDEEILKDRTSEIDKIRNLALELDESIKQVSGRIEKKASEKEKISGLLNEVETEISIDENNLSSLKDELISIASELKVLEELQRKLAGYKFSVKRLIEAKNKGELKGIIGPVIDLIKVENGFEKAVEAALGSKGQYVVVEKFSDGLAAVEYLKKTGGGRATFIPLEDFEPNNINETACEVPESEGYLGKVLDKVSVDKNYAPVINHLLKNSLIFKDLESGREARKRYHLKQLIVTLDGDLHYYGGIFTGGSTDIREEGPLVRRSRIDELTRTKKEKEIDMSSVVERLNMARALRDEHNRNVKSIESEITGLKEEKSAELSRYQYLSTTITTLEKDLEELGGQRDKTGLELTNLVDEISKLKQNRVRCERQFDEISKESEDDENRKKEIIQSRSLREDEMNRLKIHISSREQESEHIKSIIADIENRHDKLSNQVGSLRDELIIKLGREEEAESEYIKLKYKAETEIERLSMEEDEEKNLKSGIDSKRDELNRMRNRISELQTEAEQIDAKRESQSVRVAKMETELVAYLKKVAELEDIKREFPDLLNVESEDFERFLNSSIIDDLPPRKQLMDELDEINIRLAEIGEVNVLAERDFENYQRRKTFLDSQKDDLAKSIDEAMETLGEIESESKKDFKEVFELTKINFEKIFQELFPSGKAELLLSDPNDLLESGLEIKVKFPGKKELDLLQFSGGERSIIAIAFLFAVLKSKPPSFVILDEVEAALDDVNVEKFISLIKKFSDKFQFIIVTHNKLTMEYARELWGITMKKGGMSQVVSISLDEWIREHPEDVQVTN